MSKQIPLTRRTKTVQETATIIGVEYETVLGLIRSKRIDAIHLGNRYLVPDVAIARFLGEEMSELGRSLESVLEVLDALPASTDTYHQLLIAEARHLLAEQAKRRETS